MPVNKVVGTCCCGGSGSGSGSGVLCGGCPTTPIPSTLHVTISGVGCMDGTYVLTQGGSGLTSVWLYAAPSSCGACSLTIEFSCLGNIFLLILFLSRTGFIPCGPTGGAISTIVCSPFQITFSGNNGNLCYCTTALPAGAWTAVVTD